VGNLDDAFERAQDKAGRMERQLKQQEEEAKTATKARDAAVEQAAMSEAEVAASAAEAEAARAEMAEAVHGCHLTPTPTLALALHLP
jgi:predicted  nucleic acid-binding Zn-ribbon protein